MVDAAKTPITEGKKAQAVQLSSQAQYWKTRLDHTVRHTQQSTRLIYIINGAIGAAIYFVISNKEWLWRKDLVILLLVVLAILNFLHALFILVQGKWYRDLDDAYATAVGAKRVKSDSWLGLGSHRIYATMHFILSAALLVLSAVGYRVAL